ncbi:hypothetical protein [Nonlabens xylanidelens]|nr:hypothetical protein [Nonlabens xylanidelens]
MQQTRDTMFDFDQYLGFLAFLGILTLGFWLMIFLTTFVIPFWITGALLEKRKLKKEAKLKEEK